MEESSQEPQSWPPKNIPPPPGHTGGKLPEGVTMDEKAGLTQTLIEARGGDRLGELSAAFAGLLAASEDETIPEIDGEVTVLPLTDPGALISGEGDDEPPVTPNQARNIMVLYSLKDERGNGSGVYRAKWGNGLRNGYLALLANNEQGELDMAVAETVQENNACFVWRRTNDGPSFEGVFSTTKGDAAEHCLRIRHDGELIDDVIRAAVEVPLENWEQQYKGQLKAAGTLRSELLDQQNGST